jgi:hypothetical protein
MTNEEALENPFGPGGAYSGGSSMFARGQDLRSPGATVARSLKNKEMAIYGAINALNVARKQARLPPAIIFFTTPENSPMLAEALLSKTLQEIILNNQTVVTATLESAGNPLLDHSIDELMEFALEGGEFGMPSQVSALRRYFERIQDLRKYDSSEPAE